MSRDIVAFRGVVVHAPDGDGGAVLAGVKAGALRVGCGQTSKHAVTGMTRAFAAELGAHIRVNGVHPGVVETPMGSG